ncbi:MAG: hypothetical protein HYY22_09220 [Thaumarchaeota archaeon]|nr:hypothetical protein [Nitrososphaerota archaeon]
MQKEGVPVIILGDEVFSPHSYKLESELEKLAVEHAEELFGKNIHFFNVKRKIASKTDIGSIPDGYLVDLASDKFFIIEVELSSHDIVGHIMSQLFKFKMAMDSPGTRNDLAKFLAGTVSDGSKVSDTSYLARVIEKGVGIFIIIDSISEQLREVVEHLAKDGTDVRAIPFETYANSRNQFVHKFTTFTREALEQEAKKWTFKWTTVPIAKHLEKSDETVKEVFEKLSQAICCLPNAKQVTRKGWTTFQTSPLKNFCTIKILKDGLEVSLKADKKTFKDKKGITRDLKRTPAWTFDKVFTVKSPDEVEYAVSLIKQAHECICAGKR